jgi:hypothetical protein
MDKKLITLCQRMLLLFRFLLIALPLIVLFSWAFPDNAFSMTMYLGSTIGHSISGDLRTALQKFQWNNKAFGIAGSLVSLLPLLIGLHKLVQLFKNYIQGNIFTAANAKIYGVLGYLCLSSALLFQPFCDMLYSLAISINYPAGHRYIAFGFGNTNLTAIICGAFLIVIAHVMRIGHKINEEQELTI